MGTPHKNGKNTLTDCHGIQPGHTTHNNRNFTLYKKRWSPSRLLYTSVIITTPISATRDHLGRHRLSDLMKPTPAHAKEMTLHTKNGSSSRGDVQDPCRQRSLRQDRPSHVIVIALSILTLHHEMSNMKESWTRRKGT
jgi:hypothetical protein